jgi:hypothetical protein
MFQNGPRRQGFASPRTNRAPLNGSGPFRKLGNNKGKAANANAKPFLKFAALSGLPLVGPELLTDSE